MSSRTRRQAKLRAARVKRKLKVRLRKQKAIRRWRERQAVRAIDSLTPFSARMEPFTALRAHLAQIRSLKGKQQHTADMYAYWLRWHERLKARASFVPIEDVALNKELFDFVTTSERGKP